MAKSRSLQSSAGVIFSINAGMLSFRRKRRDRNLFQRLPNDDHHPSLLHHCMPARSRFYFFPQVALDILMTDARGARVADDVITLARLYHVLKGCACRSTMHQMRAINAWRLNRLQDLMRLRRARPHRTCGGHCPTPPNPFPVPHTLCVCLDHVRYVSRMRRLIGTY